MSAHGANCASAHEAMIPEAASPRQVFEEHAPFEALLVELSTRFINLEAKEVVLARLRLPLAGHRLQDRRERDAVQVGRADAGAGAGLRVQVLTHGPMAGGLFHLREGKKGLSVSLRGRKR